MICRKKKNSRKIRTKTYEETKDKAVIERVSFGAAYTRGPREEKFLVGDKIKVQHKITKKWNMVGKVVSTPMVGTVYCLQGRCGQEYLTEEKFLKLVQEKGPNE